MSILDRLNLLLRSEISSIRAPRTGGARKQIERTLADARASLKTIFRSERRLNQEYQNALDEVQRLEDLAVRYLQDGDESRAEEVMREKVAADERAAKIGDQLHEHQEQLRDLRSALDAIEYRVQASRDRTEQPGMSNAAGSGLRTPPPEPPAKRGGGGSYYERYRSGEYKPASRPTVDPRPRYTPDPPPPAPSSGSEPGYLDVLDEPFERFGEMEGRIRDLEAQVGATAELSDPLDGYEDPLRDDLIDKFRSLERTWRGPRQLERLKRRTDDQDVGDSALERLRKRMDGDD